MKILLTGGTGYIGSHTCCELLSKNFEIIILDDLSNSSPDVLTKIRTITGKSPQLIKCDLRNQESIEKALQGHNIHAVIHFAGKKSVNESVLVPDSYYETNVVGTLNLLRIMQRLEIRKFVFSSSAAVYGDPHYLPIDEVHPISAKSPYARTKLVVENILKDYAAADSHWKIVCLRYFNPVGAHDSGLIGESPLGVPDNIMPLINRVASKQLASLSVFGGDYATVDGSGLRDFVHVVDLAEGHSAALDSLDANDQGFSIYNLGSGKGTTVLELIEAYNRATGIIIPYEIVDRRLGDVEASYADVSLAEADLKWKAKRSLEEMCASSWKFFARNIDSNIKSETPRLTYS